MYGRTVPLSSPNLSDGDGSNVASLWSRTTPTVVGIRSSEAPTVGFEPTRPKAPS